MNFYEKPVYNYALECELNEDTSKEKYLEMFYVDFTNTAWEKALKSYYILPIIEILCVVLLAIPLLQAVYFQISLCHFLLIVIGWVAVAGITSWLLIVPMLLTLKAIDELEKYA